MAINGVQFRIVGLVCVYLFSTLHCVRSNVVDTLLENVDNDRINQRKLEKYDDAQKLVDSSKEPFAYRNSNNEEQRILADLEEQIIQKHSPRLDDRVQTTSQKIDEPIIAVDVSQTENSKYCANCPYELNPTLPGYLPFVEEAIKFMDESIPNDSKHKLNRIIKVFRVVPISSNVVRHEFIMEIGESTCLKNALIDQADCPFKLDSPLKICKIIFEEQPWRARSRRITNNNCTDAEVMQVQKINRDTNAYAPEREDLEVERARDTLQRVPENPTTERPFIRVPLYRNEEESVTKFVDMVKDFDEFLEDFDMPIKSEVTTGVPVKEDYIYAEHVDHDFRANPTKSMNKETFDRKKRSSSTSKDNLIENLVKKGLEKLNDYDLNNKTKVIVGILDSSVKEVSNGKVYRITAKVRGTNCYSEISTDCPDKANDNSLIKTCEMLIYSHDKNPTEKVEVIRIECNKNPYEENRFKRGTLVGGSSPRNVTDPEVQKFANLGVKKLSKDLSAENELILVEVLEASHQVVSGSLYKIKVKYGPSNCLKGQTQGCQLKDEHDTRVCLITVWSQPWLTDKEPDIRTDCDLKQRRKRNLKGQYYNEKMLQQASNYEIELKFGQFMIEYNKTYSSVKETSYRLKVFRKNLQRIKELQKHELGTARYDVTMFADLTSEEFRARYTGYKPNLRSENHIPLEKAKIPDIKLPTEFDWRHYNIVTPVKDQGQCGSCWAFAVTGNVEGLYALKHKQLLSLSEQELVDCDKFDEGCNGGLPDNAYRAIEAMGGLELESDYPYEAEDEKCHFDKSKARVQVVSGLNITSNETQMAQWLVQNGPISIGINANAMQFYAGGISHPLKFLCSPKNLDHGVLIVGFGVHKYPMFKKVYPYWVIKNSWGPRWGEQGYYRIYRGDGSCGLNTMATSAVVS